MDDAPRSTIETEGRPAVPAEGSEQKPKWNKPTIVPLSVSLTEHTPGVGSDGDVFPDSTLP